MLTDRDWYPPLDDLPQAATVLLPGIRALVPDVVAHVRGGKIDMTPDVSRDVKSDADKGTVRFTMRGSGARSVQFAAREALSFDYRGRALIDGRSLPFTGTCVVDAATSALLDLRLSTPVEA